jgi:hypothetical protein
VEVFLSNVTNNPPIFHVTADKIRVSGVNYSVVMIRIYINWPQSQRAHKGTVYAIISMIFSEDGGVLPQVLVSGHVEYVFPEDVVASSSSSPSSSSVGRNPSLFLKRTGRDGDDIGLFNHASHQIDAFQPLLFLTDGFYCVPIGEKRKFVCHNCGKITKKMKVFQSCSEFTYCSTSCLEQHQPMLLICGEAFVALFNDPGVEFRDVQILVLLICYYESIYWSRHQSRSVTFTQLLNLKQHADTTVDNLVEASNKLIDVMRRYSIGLQLFGSEEGCTIIHKLLRSVVYNSHQLPVPTVPGTYFLGVHSVLGRINHSCCPNSILTYGTYANSQPNGAGVSTRLAFELISVRQISPSEEVTVSYVSDLSLSADTRSALLYSSFKFRCCCTRCAVETSLEANQPSDAEGIGSMAEDLEQFMESSNRGGNSSTSTEQLLEWWKKRSVLRLFVAAAIATLFDSGTGNLSSLSSLSKSLMLCISDTNGAASLIELLVRQINNADRLEGGQIVREHLAYLSRNAAVCTDVIIVLTVGVISKYWESIGCCFSYRHLEFLLKSLPAVKSCIIKVQSLSALPPQTRILQLAGHLMDTSKRVIKAIMGGNSAAAGPGLLPVENERIALIASQVT